MIFFRETVTVPARNPSATQSLATHLVLPSPKQGPNVASQVNTTRYTAVRQPHRRFRRPTSTSDNQKATHFMAQVANTAAEAADRDHLSAEYTNHGTCLIWASADS